MFGRNVMAQQLQSDLCIQNRAEEQLKEKHLRSRKFETALKNEKQLNDRVDAFGELIKS